MLQTVSFPSQILSGVGLVLVTCSSMGNVKPINRMTPSATTIADWSPLQLRRFILETISQDSAPKPASKPFHSSDDIQALIERHYGELCEQFGGLPFTPSTFRHVLKGFTTLRPGDTEMLRKSHGIMRWDERVLATMNISPYLENVRRGWYKMADLKEVTQLPLKMH